MSKNKMNELSKLMTKLVNHKDFSIFMKQIDAWRIESESKLSPEQKAKLDIMLKRK